MLCLLGVALAAFTGSCGNASGDAAVQQSAVAEATAIRAAESPPELTPEEKHFYRDMARAAWKYMEAEYEPSTGFVNAVPSWHNTTLWDLGGQLLAFVAAKELGLLSPAEFDRRTSKALSTLEKVELFRDVAFNRMYSTKDGSLNTKEGPGYSATDLGRFFVALKVLAAREPRYAAQAERIVRRNDFAQLVKAGYLHGEGVDRNAKPITYQEGRIGYEQYVATGFSQWGAAVDSALSVRQNSEPVTVLGVELLADKRSLDRLLSEPFILHGLEVGLTGDMKALAANVLKAQEARYKSTGQVTIVTEDAVAVAPHHFYYYCVYCNRKPFVVGISAPRETFDSPRWVSTKGAFGWHALFPSPYTKTATDHVASAFDPARGWATGVFEGTRKSTKTFDVTTATTLMEIAFYQLRGRKPLIEAASIAP
ncbi:MAG: DUF3131 domain-containing protein [Gemmatimonadaceae bacterium]